MTLSAIKPVLDHITRDVLVEKDTEPSLTKEMKRVMREELNNRYTLCKESGTWLVSMTPASKGAF